MDLRESWALTTEDLRQAATQLHSVDGLAEFENFLSHNELELAADVLRELADEREVLSAQFWRPLLAAYERMNRVEQVARCRLRLFECESGFVEVRLELLATSAGGRRGYVLDGYLSAAT